MMEQEDKQQAVQQLVSTLSRVRVEAIRKELENSMMVRPSGLGIKPILLKVRLQQCDRTAAGEFRTALRQYIAASLEENNEEEKVSARLGLEKASHCLILDDLSGASDQVTASLQETIVDRIIDALIGVEFTAKIASQSRHR